MKSRSRLFALFLFSVVAGSLGLSGATQPAPPPGPSTPDSPDVPRESRESLDGRKWPDASEQERGRKEDLAGKPPEQPSSEVDDFARMDTDGDGRISAGEFSSSAVAATARIADGKRRGTRAPDGGFSLFNNEGRPDQAKLFRKLDGDEDGFLSRSELEASGKVASKP